MKELEKTNFLILSLGIDYKFNPDIMILVKLEIVNEPSI